MTQVRQLQFDQADLGPEIDRLNQLGFDQLDFGVIGFDAATVVNVYNIFESQFAGLSPERVIGQQIFTAVAPCMNNFMVAQRFEDAASAGAALDVIIDYVLTLRMRPVKVRLRLLGGPNLCRRYVLVFRV